MPGTAIVRVIESELTHFTTLALTWAWMCNRTIIEAMLVIASSSFALKWCVVLVDPSLE
jgi:hypothetical protein